MDREKLTKLLALSTSTNDNEALAAIRMANAMLAKDKVTWGEIMAAGGTVVNLAIKRAPAAGVYQADEDWVAPHLKDPHVIEHMFRAVFAQPRSDNEEFWQFMDSIHNRWRQYGNLTQGQYNALRRCYNRVAKRA